MSEDKHVKRLEKLISTKEEQRDTKALDFLKSLQQSLARYGALTEKQIKAMEKIEKLSTPEARLEAEKWIKSYPGDFRINAVVCAKYYLANPPYFAPLSKKIVKDPNFIPSKSQYDALTTNAYTKKVLKEYHRKPTFGKGELVQIRDSSAIPFYLSTIKHRPCVVVENNHDFITTHAKGAKTYKLLPVGKRSTILCQERWIKNFRNKTKESK